MSVIVGVGVSVGVVVSVGVGDGVSVIVGVGVSGIKFSVAVGVLVGVIVGVGYGVSVIDGVGVGVEDSVLVGDMVCDTVVVFVGVGVSVIDGVGVEVSILVWVIVTEGVGVIVKLCVTVGVCVLVEVIVGVKVDVGVGLGKLKTLLSLKFDKTFDGTLSIITLLKMDRPSKFAKSKLLKTTFVTPVYCPALIVTPVFIVRLFPLKTLKVFEKLTVIEELNNVVELKTY